MTRLAIAILALASCQLALAETIVLKQRVSIPMFIGGKKVGSTGAPIGSQLEVLAREGTKMQVKFRNLEPVWIESSVLGIEKDTPSTQVPSAPAISTFDPLKAIKALEAPGTNAITSLLQGRTYPDPASQEEFSSSLAKFVDAKTRIAKGQRALPSVQQEVKRLRRNADVAGQPSTLNPGDTSGQERAQKIREEADTMEAEAEGEIENAQEQLDEAKSSLTQLLEGWETAEANIREEQARLAEEKKEEESKSAQDKADDSSDYVADETETSKQTEPNNDTDLVASVKKAAEMLDSADDQHQLALWYFNGEQGLPMDWDKGTYWEEKAAAQKHPEALFIMGAMHIKLLEKTIGPDDSDEDVKKLIRSPDYRDAVQMLFRAAVQGNPDAIKMLKNKFKISAPVLVKYTYPKCGIQIGKFAGIDPETRDLVSRVSPTMVDWVNSRFKEEPFYDKTVELTAKAACKTLHQMKEMSKSSIQIKGELTGDDEVDFKTNVEWGIKQLYEHIAAESGMDPKESIRQHLAD